MTGTATTPPIRATRPVSPLTFRGTLVAEWIKLRSLRSTVWCYAAVFVITVAFGLLIASVLGSQDDAATRDPQSTAALVATASVGFSQLVICVLGVLVISGEYGTGMIRSTFTAVPGRLSAVAAKMIVFAVVTFVVTLVGFSVTALVTTPILAGAGVDVDLAEPELLATLLGAAVYLTLIGSLALALGALIRHSAGGIAASIALVLVVPTLLQLMAALTGSTFPANAAAFTPSDAGALLYTYAGSAASGAVTIDAPAGLVSLDSAQGGLVLLGWVVVVAAVSAIALKRRDV